MKAVFSHLSINRTESSAVWKLCLVTLVKFMILQRKPRSIANWTQRLPPVGIPFFCLHQLSSYFATEDRRVKSISDISQFFRSFDQSGRHVSIALRVASFTRFGSSESYNALKSNVKQFIVFLVSEFNSCSRESSQYSASDVFVRRSLQKSFSRSYRKQSVINTSLLFTTPSRKDVSNLNGGSTPGCRSSLRILWIFSIG